MIQLQPVEYGAMRLALPVHRFYALCRNGILPPGVIVRLGRQIRVDPALLEEFIARGGMSLPGGWRREPPEAT
jgi:hypothetical protein